MEGVNVCGQRLARGVRVILLVEGDVVLCDLSHVGPGMVGSSVRCMSVPALEDLLFPAEIHISRPRLQACSNLHCCLLCLPPGVLYEVLLDGFCEGIHHVPVMAWIVIEGRELFNQLDIG